MGQIHNELFYAENCFPSFQLGSSISWVKKWKWGCMSLLSSISQGFISQCLLRSAIRVKKEEFISHQEYRVSWYSLLWCLRLFIAFTVHELHLRVAIILKFALLFKPTFGMWRVLLQEFLRNWPESLFRSDCKKQYWSKSKLIVSSSSLVAPFRLEWGLGGVTNPWNIITVDPVNSPVRYSALESHTYWLEIKLLRELDWIQYRFQPLLF